VLFWGVLGALVMRVIMIVAGTELIERFHWIIYVFGAFLIYTGTKMFSTQNEDIDPENRFVVKLVTRYVPIVRHYERRKFFTVVDGKTVGTLLLLVLIVVEFTDLVFALDSIPAIFGVTTDRFIVYTSNVFAILGLRTFYFLLAGVIERFHYLKFGLGIVLGFIGIKMLLPLIAKGLGSALLTIGFVSAGEWVKARTGIPTHIALGIVALVLVSSVLISLIRSRPTPKDR
jgi:tellurite resistance protein TerC